MTPCIAEYFDNPFFKKLDVSQVQCAKVAESFGVWYSSVGTVSPEDQAADFYLYNHLVSYLKTKFTINETLPVFENEIIKNYRELVIDQGGRLFRYLLMIVTREARHVNSSTELFEDLNQLFNPECVNFIKSLGGNTSKGSVHYFLNQPPKVVLGEYLCCLVRVFETGIFSHGFGGMPWANIAKTVLNFVMGIMSMELLIDSTYTLSHNNGPIFNKGVAYLPYSPHLYKVLDVQRSGQIPELFLESTNVFIQNFVLKFRDKYPLAFGTSVDWYQVEALGSIKKYPKEKEAQGFVSVPTQKQKKSFEYLPGKLAHIVDREVCTV